MRKKLLSILALLCLTVSSAWAGTQATGYFESCTAYHGSIRVKGWAYDPDQPATSIQVHAYIWYGSSVGTTKDERMPAVGINANIERSDVNEAKGITGAHGFDQYIAVPAGTYTVQVFAIDKTGDGNPKIPGTSGNPATYTVTVTDPYTITYDANGGSGAPDAQQKSEKININLSAAKPTRDGYVFKEWNTAQDGSGDSYAPGAAYTADGDATLYAQWLEIVASGDCGTGVTYSLTEDGVMTISGTGEMAECDPAPWDANKNVITSIIIEEGVTTIADGAFEECANVASVSIPASVTSIGGSAFSQAGTSATTMTVTIAAGSNLATIGGDAFSFCSSLETITIPSSVTTIGMRAFVMSGLTSVTLSDGLKVIDGRAFMMCPMTTITIPASVTSIGESAFKWCSDLATVTLNSNPFIGEDAFTDIADGAAVTMNLTANAAGGAKWATFYNKLYSFEADANTQVFKAGLSGTSITLYEVTDKIVDAGIAVVLKSTDNPVMTLTTSASSNSDSNSLEGVSDAAGTTSDGTMYVLNNGTKGVGFYKLTSGKTLGVGKAYLYYDSSTAPGFFGFEDGTTNISTTNFTNDTNISGEYFNLAGQRVAQPTKGLYIVNGKKVVIK